MLLTAVVALAMGMPSRVSAEPAPPGWHTVAQPDGTPLRVRFHGDERRLTVEDDRGFALIGVGGPKGTEWHYAGREGAALYPSGLLAGVDDPSLGGISPGLGANLHAPPLRMKTASARRVSFDVAKGQRPPSKLSLGVRHSRPLVLLVRFPGDLPAGAPRQTYQRAQFADLLFAADLDPSVNGLPATYQTSLRDYYNEVSRGELRLTSTIADVIEWVEVPEPYAYYVDGQSGLAGHPRNSSGLLEHACNAVDADVDFSQYDIDGDGRVDHVVLVVESWADGTSNLFWPHAGGMGTQAFELDGKTIDAYYVVTEQFAFAFPDWGVSPRDIRPIGTFAHEMGHVLGLPDLYDAATSRPGIGNWGLMGSGNWANQTAPSYLSAWSRIRMGWVSPVEAVGDGSVSQLASIEGGGDVVRVWVNPWGDAEYFLLENRRRQGADLNIPSSGLLVWHVDENLTDNFPTRNDVNVDPNHPGLGLEQADGLRHLENDANYGDVGDPFPGSNNARTFDRDTNPSSRAYSGEDSGVAIGEISAPLVNMSCSVTGPEKVGYRIQYDKVAGSYGFQWGLNYQAVRFQVPETGYAHTVNVWMPGPNMGYTVSLRAVNAPNRPGAVLWSGTGNTASTGWLRVDVESPLLLAAESEVFIVARLTGYAYAVAADSNLSTSGRSYASPDGINYQSLSNDLNLRLVVDRCTDLDADGWRVCDGDCNDENSAIYPGHAEACNQIDDDCDGQIDENLADTDGDGIVDCNDPDDDGDTIEDASDPAPLDRFRCGDADADTCDDCTLSGGPPRTTTDGLDADGDGLCNPGDPDDDNDTVADGADVADFDPNRCLDADGDTCDDCSQTAGPPAVANDGLDTDADGLCNAGDPDDDGDGVNDGPDPDALDRFRCGDTDGDTCDDCAVTGGPSDAANDGPDGDGNGICDEGESQIIRPLGDPDYCTPERRCATGEGDCDADGECQEGLGCFPANGPRFGLLDDVDVCQPAGCFGAGNGDREYCAPDCPCVEGEGDCDGHAECAPGFFCASNRGAEFGMPWSYDICAVETCSIAQAPGVPDACSPTCRCPAGVGHCRADADCADGLACAPVGPDFGYGPEVSVCKAPDCAGGTCTADCRCAVGVGHCEDDAGCEEGLVCRPTGVRFGFDNAVHVCQPAACYVQSGDGREFCTLECPCLEGEGDCDGHADCAPDLYCASNRGAEFGMPSGFDICAQEICVVGQQAGDPDACSPTCRCAAGRGHCASDADCADGLLCAPDGSRFGYAESVNVCQAGLCGGGAPDEAPTCSADCPCAPGVGHCIADEDCEAGLSCRPTGDRFGFTDGRSVCQTAACYVDGTGTSEHCQPECPCLEGEGDCDGHAECAGDLICASNRGAEFGMPSGYDICSQATCEVGVAPGDPDACSATCRCAEGRGHCQLDADCQPGLVCDPNGPRFGYAAEIQVCQPTHCDHDPAAGVPTTCSDLCRCAVGVGHCEADSGCQEGLVCRPSGSRYGYAEALNVNVCQPAHCYTLGTGDREYCQPECPCLEGEGDCDGHAECVGDLICASNRGAEFGMPSGHDICAPAECVTGQAAGEPDLCSPACRCAAGRGHCTGDADCEAGLACTDNGPIYGYAEGVGVCEADDCVRGAAPGVASVCTSSCLCGLKEGHCASDADCADGLACTPNGGRGGYSDEVNLCLPASCYAEGYGGREYCQPECPCVEGEGDCDGHAECVGNLICDGNRGAEFGMPSGHDICAQTECVTGQQPTDPDACSPTCRCAEGRGHCETDADCVQPLVCLLDDGRFGFPEGTNVCQSP